jgi:hypothetical protein
MTASLRKPDVNGNIRDCVEFWTRMQIALALRDRDMKENMRKVQERSMILLEALRTCLGQTSAETSIKFNKFNNEIVKLEASQEDARQQIRFLSSTGIVDVVEEKAQAVIAHDYRLKSTILR